MSFGWYHLVVTTVIDSYYSYNISFKSLTFFFWLKNKIPLMKPLTLFKTFPYLLIFPSTKFWSSYIAWLYIKRTKLHTKGQTDPSLSHPIILKLHFAATYTFSYFPISFAKSLFIDNNITHILQHTIIHYPFFPHSIILKLHHFCYPKTHLHPILYFLYKISLLRKQHNP